MRLRLCMVGFWIAFAGCGGRKAEPMQAAPAAAPVVSQTKLSGGFAGFDRNSYPGDATMQRLKKQFAYTGYWLTPPPGGATNSWAGKRAFLRDLGYGFLVLANGRIDRQIKASKLSPAALGQQDAAKAIASAKAEGFPAKTIIFLDQEEGGRLLEEQSGYLFGWTEAVASSDYLPGVYASGQPLPDGPGVTITTIQDIRERVTRDHLHPIAVWVYQDACAPAGPAPGCTATLSSPDASGTLDIAAWQYAQSPRRKAITQSCSATYASDGNCYPAGEPGTLVDLNVAGSADPSSGR